MWMLEIKDGDFKYHNVVDVVDILDMGDTYNVVTDMCGNMWLPKRYCYLDHNMIQYRGEGITVSLQDME